MARNPRAVELSSHSPSRHLGQGPRGERGPGFGVTAELGEKATTDRDQRRDIHQHAAGPADGRLERLPGRARGRPLGRVQQRLHLLHPAAGDGQCAWASSSRGRDRTRSSGNADSHR